MSAAYAHLTQATGADPSTFLGPARVVAMVGSTPTVLVDGAEVRAEMALAYPYAPREVD